MKKNFHLQFVNAAVCSARMIVLISLLATQFFGAAVPAQATDVSWIIASAQNDWIQAHDWLNGIEITLTINGNPIDTVTIGVAPWNPGEFGAEFHTAVVVGDVVSISGGGVTKTLTVSAHAVTDINVAANTVSGISTLGAAVEVCANIPGDCIHRSVYADIGTGAWAVNFTPDFTLLPGSNGWAGEWDADGDATWYDWDVPNPWLNASAQNDWIQAHGWPDGTEVDLTINGNLIDTATIGVAPWDPGEFGVEFSTAVAVDDVVSISGGGVTKTLTVSPHAVTDINLAANTVSGISTLGAAVEVCANIPGNCIHRSVNADGGTGAWTVNFTPDFTLLPGSNGWAGEWDADGDATWYDWNVLNPVFTVQPDHGWVQGQDWTIGNTASVTVDDPVTGLCSPPDQVVAGDGSVWFQVEPDCDLRVGQTVTLSDGVNTKSTQIEEVYFDTINVSDDNAIGRGPASWLYPVDVYVRSNTGETSLGTTIDSLGDWAVDFTSQLDIQMILDANVRISDIDGDGIMAHLWIPNFQARMTDNEVHGYNWTLGGDVTLEINDPDILDPDFGPATLPAIVAPWDPSQTFVQFSLGSFTLQPGQLVTMTDGNITKELTITDLSITDINPLTDTVSGTSTSSDIVEVGTLCDPNGCALRRMNPLGSIWSLDFSTPGGPTPEEQYPYDIKGGDGNEARQYDLDNDATQLAWQVSYPGSVIIPAGDPIELAASLDLSLAAKVIGESANKAIQMAVDDFGPINGFAVQVNTFDSKCGSQMDGYQSAADIIFNTQNVGVIGHTCSASFKGGLPIYESVNMVTISGSSTVPDVPDFGPNVFNRTTLFDPFADPWILEIQSLPGVTAWSADYHARYGEDPNPLAVLYYDATRLLLQRIKDVAVLSGGDLEINRSTLASQVRATIKYRGVSGCFSLDSQGNRVNEACSTGSFNKTGPANGAFGQSATPTLSWGMSAGAADGYHYCITTTPTSSGAVCDTGWQSVLGTTVTPTLLLNRVYYWQVRYTGDHTYANSGAWFRFSTQPGGFNKGTPYTGSVGQSSTPTLTWGPSNGASSYEYCVGTISGTCDVVAYTNVGNVHSATVAVSLPLNATYYWQVRAVSSGPAYTYANSGAWFRFSTQPGAFNKGTPYTGSVGQSATPTLTWGPSNGASSYEYCVGTISGTCDVVAYTNVGNVNSATVAVSLPLNATYYWQVRAVSSGPAYTYANSGAWFTFSTQPGAFNKGTPYTGSVGQSATPTLTWGPSNGASSYEYCVGTISGTCDVVAYTNVGNVHSATVAVSLPLNATYYWQVRAVSSGPAYTYANSGAWFRFSTQPGVFNKGTPYTGSVGQSATPTLTWGPSNGASSYEYCVGTISGTCDVVAYTNVGNVNSATVAVSLPLNATYYWQVRAVSSGPAYTYANSGAWFTFSTQPGVFNKGTPYTGSVGQSATPTLTWGPSNGAASYSYCIGTTAGGCDVVAWTSVGNVTGYTLIVPLTANTTYYWQVKSVSAAGGERLANGGAWFQFKTAP